MNILYLVRNRIDGDRYVGITNQSIGKRNGGTRRWVKAGKSHPFYDALRHFGEGAFEWSILAKIDDRKEALHLEAELTRLLKPEYNLVYGGGGRANYIRPVEERATPSLKFLPTPDVEEWRPVVGYEGLYEVSSHGAVRGLDRMEDCMLIRLSHTGTKS